MPADGTPRLGFLAAMPAEAATLTRGARPGRIVALAPGVDLLLGGIGARRAARAAATLLDAGAEVLVSWGSAAGLDPDLGAGSLVLPREIRGAGGETYAADPATHARWLARLETAVGVSTGAVADAGGLLTGPESKRVLAARTGAVAADMESAAVADAARTAGRGWAAVRVVLDPAGMTVPPCVAAGIDGRGRVRPFAFTADLLRRPGQVPDLAVLVGSYRKAVRTLRTAARALVAERPEIR